MPQDLGVLSKLFFGMSTTWETIIVIGVVVVIAFLWWWTR